MSVRSKQLVGSGFTTSFVTYYTVPTGYVTIVKSMVAKHFGTNSDRLQCFLAFGSGGAQQYDLADVTSAVSAFQVRWDGWVVLKAGDTIQGRSQGSANWSCLVSGAELLLTA